MVDMYPALSIPNTDGSGRLPSIFVQLFWTAIVGPWILWKIRSVNDVHYWAWCVTSGCNFHLTLIYRASHPTCSKET